MVADTSPVKQIEELWKGIYTESLTAVEEPARVSV